MASFPEPTNKASSSTPFNTAARTPDDTVFYAIFPDDPSSLPIPTLHLQILQTLAPFTSDYIWQHEPFSLSPVSAAATVPHLRGKLRFGDNLADEWFVVFLLLEASRAFPEISVRVWDSDGEFLLIEAAHHLPRWLDPDTSQNRVFLRRGNLHIVPRSLLPNPTLEDSLRFLARAGAEAARATEPVQEAILRRVSDYPEKAKRDMHRVRVRVPPAVAAVLSREPCLISLAVEGFYDRDVDSMKSAAKMERFLPEKDDGDELVLISIKMSRAMYAQLAGQAFRAPSRYPVPRMGGGAPAEEAETGMKIACGFEMAYQQRKNESSGSGGGGAWEVFRQSLEQSGFFGDSLPGSQDHRRLVDAAKEYYRNSSSFSATSEIMSAPVKRIDEILASPYSAEDFKAVEVPPSDDDSWLRDGEAELNAELLERQKELDLYNAECENKEKRKMKKKTSEECGGEGMNVDDKMDPSEIVKTMRAFVSKVSSYEGAEVPQNDRNMKEVDLDVERFFKDMESIMNPQEGEEEDEGEEGSSDMDFEDSEEDENENEDFTRSYFDALNEELKGTSLPKSFARAEEQASGQAQAGPSSGPAEMEFSPVDVDVNLVKSLLDSFASQEGLPGPASNLLGLMGLQLQDPKKVNPKSK